MLYANNFLTHIYENLGNRFDAFNSPGFIRTYRPQLFQLAIITPIVVEIVKYIFDKQYFHLFSNNTHRIHKTNDSDPQKTPVDVTHPSEQPILGQPTHQNSNRVSIFGLDNVIHIKNLLSINKKNLLNNSYRVLKENSIPFLTSLTVLALFVLFQESPLVVCIGYTTILLGHSLKAIQAYEDKSIYDLIKHILSASITVSTLIAMGSRIYDIRWHHMSYGLLCLLCDFRNVNFFGFCMVADSMLYWMRPLKDNYDFSNIFTDHLSAFIFQLSSLSLYEISKRVFSDFKLSLVT